jgi:hypothetical protein
LTLPHVLARDSHQEEVMGQSLILWLVGVPIPIIIVLWFFMH